MRSLRAASGSSCAIRVAWFPARSAPRRRCDGARGLRDAFAQVVGPAGDDQRGGGIQQHGVAIGPGGAAQQRAAAPSAFSAASPPLIAATGARGRPASSGVDGEGRRPAVAQFDHLVFAGHGQFVQALAVHQPGALAAQRAPASPPSAAPSRGRTRRSAAAAPAAGFASGPRRLKIVRVPSSTRGPAAWRIDGWWRGREQEHAAGGAQDAGQPLHRRVDVDAERGQHVGAAGARRQRAVAVLGDRHAERRRRTKVTAVETFSVPAPSPPVPQTSIAPSGRLDRGHARRAWPGRRR